MERTKGTPAPVAEERTKVNYKKIGGGSLRLAGKIIKPGQVFKAYPEDIPPAFRDVIVAVDGTPAWNAPPVKPAAQIEVVKPVYELKPRGKSKSLFDVVDGQGKTINEKALPKEIAEKLIEDLLK